MWSCCEASATLEDVAVRLDDATVEINAPAGALGVIFGPGSGGQGHEVAEFRDGSSMKCLLMIGDSILTVDDIDTSSFSVYDLSIALKNKSNKERRLTIKRK